MSVLEPKPSARRGCMGEFQRAVVFQHSDVVVAYESITTPICFADAEMSKAGPSTGSSGCVLAVLPPAGAAHVLARLVRARFCTPGFVAILLLTTGEPAGFGITVEPPMASSWGDHSTP